MNNFTDDQRSSNTVGYYTAPPMVQKLNTCLSFGPLEICATKVVNDRIDIEVKLAGVIIGTGSLYSGNNQLCVGASIELVKVQVCITADFSGKTVWAEGEMCTRRWDLGWDCGGFRTILISW